MITAGYHLSIEYISIITRVQ